MPSVTLAKNPLLFAPMACLLGFFLLGDMPAAQGQVSFFTPPTYAGSGTMFVADFNGDGKKDILSGDGTLQLGKGDGTFTTGTAVKGGPLAVADFNGDGKPDVLEQGTGTLLVLLGKGDGTFQAPISTNSGANLAGLAATDLNGDGKADAVGVFGSSLVVYLSEGDGTFATGVSYNLGASSFGNTLVVLGDFNGDGKTDVTVIIAGNNVPGQVIALLGNEDGTFQSAKTSAGVYYPGSAVKGDFNGDGKLDLAISGSGPGGVGSTVFLLAGNDDGTFQAATAAFSGGGTLATADLNGDGKLDLVLETPPMLEIYLGDGSGAFSGPRSYMNLLTNVSISSASSPAIADFNLDGKSDIAAGNYVLLGNGNGTFQGQPAIPFAVAAPNGISPNSLAVVGDFGKNGIPDVAVLSSNGAVILTNDGTGTLTLTQTYGLQQPGYGIATTDLNGDGNLDLVVAGTDPITQEWSYSVLLGNGDGTFQPPAFYPQSIAGGYFSIVIADFNNDHKPDLAIGIYGSQSLAVLLGNGDGTFGPPAYVFDGGDVNLVSADFNGDGNADLAAAGSAGIAILLGNGDGTFQPAAFPFTQPFSGLLTGDLNGDGKADLVTAGEVFLGNGDGTFAAVPQSQIQGIAALDDINGDGKPDVVGAASSSCCGVYLGNGDGTFGSYTSVISFGGKFSAVSPTFLLSADMNGDGLPDLIVGETSDIPGIFVLTNTTPPLPVDFAIGPASGTQTSQTVSAGQSATFNLVITPSGSFAGTVNLACTISPAVNPTLTCKLPASVNVASGKPKPVAVTVTTVAPMAAGLTSPGRFPLGPGSLVWTVLFASGLLVMRKVRRSPLAVAPIVVLAMVWLVGCGGGGTSSHPSSGTPAGTYTATVTATSGSLHHSETLTVIVQ